jgi:cytochrome c2
LPRTSPRAKPFSRNASSATPSATTRATSKGRNCSAPGYSYSTANASSGITWDENNFAVYIKNPASFMPGTKMVFAGLSNEQEIKDLIAYLKQFSQK